MAEERVESVRGFTVLDGVALVSGAAVASVHVRSGLPRSPSLIGWLGATCLFAWLALTSAGPFLFLFRRFFTRPPGYPRLGDQLWALAGLPWITTALIRSVQLEARSIPGRDDPYYSQTLTVGIAAVSIVTIVVLGYRFLKSNPTRPAIFEPGPWTHQIGVWLAVTWPIQCGVGLSFVG